MDDEFEDIGLTLMAIRVRLNDLVNLLDGDRQNPKVAHAIAELDDINGRLDRLVAEKFPD